LCHRRCGRAAEGTRLLNEHTLKRVSRVRIPPSPPIQKVRPGDKDNRSSRWLPSSLVFGVAQKTRTRTRRACLYLRPTPDEAETAICHRCLACSQTIWRPSCATPAPSVSGLVTFPKSCVKMPRIGRGAFSYLVIPFGCAVEPERSAVPLSMAVPIVPDVDVAWSGVGSVFTPGTPVEPPSDACAGVGLVFTPGTPVAPPWAPVAPFCCASANALHSAKAVAKAIVPNFMVVSSSVERKINRSNALGSSPSSAGSWPFPSSSGAGGMPRAQPFQ
jgi:hypothetical protein